MTTDALILRRPALRAIERQHAGAALMERAGAAAATVATALLATTGCAAPPLIVCGPGNNGGDGFVLARLLRAAGHDAVVVFAGDAARLPPDAASAHAAWCAAGGRCHEAIPPGRFGLAVDAIFGIGLTRAITGTCADLVGHLNALDAPVLALDIPSGLDAETGCVHGVAVRADHTASFIAFKPGLLTAAGPDHCGTISLHDLDLPALDAKIPDSGRTVTPALFVDGLQPRRRDSHKGSYGSVAILGGAPGMAGAALLAGRAALKLGGGRVHVGMLERLAIDAGQPELMLRPPQEALQQATALAVGPGLGQTPAAHDLLQKALTTDLPALFDADALNLLAAHPVLLHRLTRRNAPTLLTPHPAEAARLLATSTAAVQSDRLGHALELARRTAAHVVLKGNGSVIATADGRWWINTTGNPALATAGSGDVLSGITVALLAQGWQAEQALLAAVHLHGTAADALAQAMGGNVGVTAGELIDAARHLFNRWLATRADLPAIPDNSPEHGIALQGMPARARPGI